MDSKVTDLPLLRAGQVWQCSDQRFTVVITSLTSGSYLRGIIWDGPVKSRMEYWYGPEHYNGVSYYVFTTHERTHQDLVRLIYDPHATPT